LQFYILKIILSLLSHNQFYAINNEYQITKCGEKIWAKGMRGLYMNMKY